MTTYDAHAQRDGLVWAVEVEGVGWTQARTLAEVEHMAKDLVATVSDIDQHTIDIDVHVALPEEARRALADAAAARDAEAQARANAARRYRDAARLLAETRMTMADIGAALGVSTARAHQLVKSGAKN